MAPALGRRLAQLVEDAGCVISTGFVGTPIICDALVIAGRPDLAYRLLLQRKCPSWLYPVTMGATTSWERWDSMLPDGSINPGDMTSFNHYALGAIADWLYRHVAGLNAEAPGFRVARISPRPGGGLESAGARHETPYGPLEVRWSAKHGGLTVDFTVPVGVTAILDLPGIPQDRFTHGRHSVELPAS
jgi:alpha-L-rhamnosidase